MAAMDEKLIDPRDCRYRLNKQIRHLIERLLKGESADKDCKQRLEDLMQTEESEKQTLSYDSLSEIHKCLQRLDKSYELFFYQLMEKCKRILPESRKNPELEARLQRLKLEESQKAYRLMTNDITVMQKETISMKQEVMNIKPILIALINALMVIAATFCFLYKVIEWTLPLPNVSVQVLFALLGSGIVAIAELYFFVRIM